MVKLIDTFFFFFCNFICKSTKNKIRKVCCLVYTEIPDMFFIPLYGQWWQQVASFIVAAQGTVDLTSLFKGVTNAAVVFKVIVIMLWVTDDLGSHCCYSVFQQLSCFPLLQQHLPAVILAAIVATLCQQWLPSPVWHCGPTKNLVPIVATVCSSSGIGHCCSSVSSDFWSFWFLGKL